MKRNKEALGSVAFMCGFALLSVTASCQYLAAGATGTLYPNMPVIVATGERIEKYIEINESFKMIVDPFETLVKKYQ